ncbi:Cell death protease [Coemansia umbellata]|nr:Cell death protease [Coemansia umbellata]
MKSNKNVMFFWLVTNTTNTQNQDKLVVWLNGGPGCTSLDGLFMENGPFKFSGPNELKFRDYSLSQQFDVLYIDQPFGTSFSVAKLDDYAKSFKDASRTLLDFFENFYKVFPEYRQRQLYLAGESEAGTYIPYLANDILQMPESDRFNLGGLMIGNGWIDPYPMYMSYIELLRERSLLTPNIQKKILNLMDECTHEFNRAPQPVHTDICEHIPIVFIDEGGPSPGICYNQYDLRLTDTMPACGMNWPTEVGMFTDYFNRKDVQQAINVKGGMAPAKWVECNTTPNAMLKADTSPPAVNFLKSILDHVPVLLFVGKEDYLCNYIGIEWSLGNLTWAGTQGFSAKSKRADWTIGGSVVGQIHSDRGLTYALVHDASHMVGVDKPREILDLFTAFTNSSATNLRFTSSLRTAPGENNTIAMPPPQNNQSNGLGVGKWIGLSFLLVLALLFFCCFLCRRRLFNWWIKRRGYSRDGIQRADDDGLVASRGNRNWQEFGRMLDEDEMDDAFMMSEFSFTNPSKLRKNITVEELLLDDDAASSPDEDVDSRTIRGSRNNSKANSPPN